MSSSDRRALLVRAGRLALAAAAPAALGACGFRLRGAERLPFETLYIAAPPESGFAAELARNIRAGTGTRLVADRKDAQAILELGQAARDREVLSLNAQGRAREIQLKLAVAFNVHDGKGRDILPRTELLATRDVAVNESLALANEAEQSLLFRDMQTDLVQQMLRRLARAR